MMFGNKAFVSEGMKRFIKLAEFDMYLDLTAPFFLDIIQENEVWKARVIMNSSFRCVSETNYPSRIKANVALGKIADHLNDAYGVWYTENSVQRQL